MPDDDADNPLAIEIKQEKAAAYFAVCKKMLASIEALQAFDRNLPLRDVTSNKKRAGPNFWWMLPNVFSFS